MPMMVMMVSMVMSGMFHLFALLTFIIVSGELHGRATISDSWGGYVAYSTKVNTCQDGMVAVGCRAA